jgi:hypothetical protein
MRRLGRPVVLLGPFSDAAQAEAAVQGTAIDALLIHEPQLHAGWLASTHAAAPTLAAVPTAVLYAYAAESVCEALGAAGTQLLREPQSDTVITQWLSSLCTATTASRQGPEPTQERPAAEAVRPRRWDDAALADFAGLSSTIACECPRHVAELLMQLSHFEAYSAECEQRSATDAQLHGHLRQVAATSRAHFETALEYVALHEGLILPA